MGRLLTKAIDAMKEDTVIFVGSKTNYFFIGTKEEFYRDLDKIEAFCKEFVERSYYQSAETWEQNVLAGLPSRADFDSDHDWKEAAKRTVTALNNAQQLMQHYEKEYGKYKPVIDRGTVEEYERTQGDGHVIIVSGIEIGKYWFRSEYQKANAIKEVEA